MTRTDDLQVETTRFPMGTIVRVIGDAALSCESLELTLTRLSAERPSVVVIDLAKCSMLSSLAIGMIMSFSKGLKLHDGQLRLAAANSRVLNSLKYAGLSGLLPVFDTAIDALA